MFLMTLALKNFLLKANLKMRISIEMETLQIASAKMSPVTTKQLKFIMQLLFFLLISTLTISFVSLLVLAGCTFTVCVQLCHLQCNQITFSVVKKLKTKVISQVVTSGKFQSLGSMLPSSEPLSPDSTYNIQGKRLDKYCSIFNHTDQIINEGIWDTMWWAVPMVCKCQIH